jgi:hypothetical protein
MNMIPLSSILIYSFFVSLAIGVLILGSLYINPRIWLQDYPAEIRAKVPPNTPDEKRAQRLLMIPFLGTLIGAPLWFVWQLEGTNGGTLPFGTAFVIIAIILHVFNLFDAVVIDFLILTLMKPKFAVIPGAEGMEHLYANWRLQVGNFFKGIVICTVLSIPIALVAQL